MPDLYRSPMPAVILTLPWPPSINHYYRSVIVGTGKKLRVQTLVSLRGREYRKQVGYVVLQARCADDSPPIRFEDQKLKILILAHPPDARARDLDNILKAMLDALQAANVFNNDSQIDELTIRRCGKVQNGALLVAIEEIKE